MAVSLVHGAADAGVDTPEMPTESVAASRDAALANVLRKIDFREITPNEFDRLAHDLHQSGLIVDSELEALLQVMQSLDTQQLDADEPVDLLAMLSKQLRDYQASVDQFKAVGQSPPQATTERLASAEHNLRLIERMQSARHGTLFRLDAVA